MGNCRKIADHEQESSTSQVAGPTLLPAVHWEYPLDDIRNLAPINTSDLYYSYNGISGEQHCAN